MIYYKKKSLIKKVLNKFKNVEKEKKSCFLPFLKTILFLLIFLLIGAYSFYLFWVPEYLNEADVEKAINNYVLKNSNLSIDIKNLEINPNYKFDINLKADEIRVIYPTKSKFLSLEKANIDVNLLSLISGYIDLNKIKISKIKINTAFNKQKRYECFKYFDFLQDKKASKFKIRNINLLADEFLLNIFDENIDKSFLIKSNKLKISSSEFRKPILITTNGIIKSSNHKISDFDLKLSIKINPDSVGKFRQKLQNLSYNPLYFADFYKFYSKTNIDLKINPSDKKSNILGYVDLKNYTFEINGLKLPQNNLFLNFKNNKIYTNSDFKFIKNQQIQIISTMSFDKNKFIEAKLLSNEINLTDLKEISNVASKILNLKFNLDDISLVGFARVNVYLKSNFKTITSNGKLSIHDAKLYHKKIGLTLNSIESNINFENNSIDIINSSALINGAKFSANGKIDNKMKLDLKIKSDIINIAQILTLIKELPILSSCAPHLKDYDFKNGFIKINTQLSGSFEKPIVKSDSTLTDLKIYAKKVKANLEIPKFELKFLQNDIIIPKTALKINSIPASIQGVIKNYKTKNSEVDLKLDSQFYDDFILINGTKPKLNAQINVKQDKINIISANVSNAIFVYGSIFNLQNSPSLNLRVNSADKTYVKFLKHNNINVAILGNLSILGNIQTPDIEGKFNFYDINLPTNDLKISQGILNIKNKNYEIEIPSASIFDIVLNSISFNVLAQDNFLNISNFSAQTLNGEINSNAKIDLNNQKISTKTNLKELNIRLLPNNLKEMLLATSGKLSAVIESEFNLNSKNILDSLESDINFNIINGELSQFAKLERFLQAGNILSQSILKLSLNSVLSAITKQNTGDFREIQGKIEIKNAIANIIKINSQGSNMSFNMSGNINLFSQNANLKILGRIPNSMINIMGNFGKFSFSQQVEKSGSEVSKTLIEKKLSTAISPEDFMKIPPLAYYDSTIGTREFIVLINGIIKNLSSIQDFKWAI